MKPVHYFLILDVAVILLGIKIIFGNYRIFMKSLAHHFFPDDYLPNPQWDLARNISSFKRN
jgi:hypothetical protein